MHILSWLFGGIVGGAVGAAVWVFIEYSAQSEFAWMAWPVGLLVGLGVRKFAAADNRGGFLRGTVAALLALAAIMGAGWAKQKILTKQAAQAVVPAVLITDSETEGEGQGNTDETMEVVDQVTVDFGEPSTGLLHGTFDAKSGNALQSMDMLWLCLAALTAYVVGKGAGSDSVPRKEPASEESADGGQSSGEQAANGVGDA